MNFAGGWPWLLAWFGLEEASQPSRIVVGGSTPEPGSWVMLATGFAALAAFRRRLKRSN